jgi:hypothetical protein
MWMYCVKAAGIADLILIPGHARSRRVSFLTTWQKNPDLTHNVNMLEPTDKTFPEHFYAQFQASRTSSYSI